ncbi:MAG: hypothetical protein NC452_10270 [Eubacterium sp.]|nr:hypothetical protein [Eubacterium sp.]
MFCINLCELYNSYFFKNSIFDAFVKYISLKKSQPIERIYLGSSFCSQYFLGMSNYEYMFSFCAEKGLHITLTVPVFTEKDISLGKKKIEEICKKSMDTIDEITVNDLGMLSYFRIKQPYRINLGRLFFKDPRDCRCPNFTKEMVSPMLLSHLTDDYWRFLGIGLVELDTTNLVINTTCIENIDVDVGLHMPYCYMTTGNICKFASIHQDVQHKFRPNQQCGMECAHIFDSYSGHIAQTACNPSLIRYGRTLYFEVESVKLVGKEASRVIYFPINEWRKFVNENIGSFKHD